MKISVVIPALNEEKVIGETIRYLQGLDNHSLETEIWVIDGNSQDQTREEAERSGASVAISEQRGRSVQMNHGAALAKGEVLYFLHADTLPPASLFEDIEKAVQNGYDAGCYPLKFDTDHWFLNLNAWFSKFDVPAFRYGDQSLFITRSLFQKLGGYDQELILLEDNDMVSRIKKEGRFKLFSKRITTSARKYRDHGIYRLQWGYYKIYMLYAMGASQEKLIEYYQKLVSR